MLGWGQVLDVTASGPDRFQSIRRSCSLVEQVSSPDVHPKAPEPRWFGGFSYRPTVEAQSSWTGLGSARFRLPRYLYVRDGETAWLMVNRTEEEPEQPWVERLHRWAQTCQDLPRCVEPPASSTFVRLDDEKPDRSEWLAACEQALDEIDSETLRKVVLARRSQLEVVSSDSPALVNQLTRGLTGIAQWVFERSEEERFFCHSPEYLVSLDETQLRTECLAGTAARASSQSRDRSRRHNLQQSRKDHREHQLVVDYVRDQLQPRVEQLTFGNRRTRQLEDLHHLCTPVQGRVSPKTHVLSLVRALHPTPAVGGLPTDRAMDFQRRHEPYERGWYASPIGWFTPGGDGVFTVGIRGGHQAGNQLDLYAGAGLVQGSFPHREWEEVELKQRSLLNTFGLRVR